MRMIAAAEVDACLNFPDLVAALREAFRRGAVQPVRHHHAVERPSGAEITLLLMPAWTDFAAAGAHRDGHVGVKIVTVSPENNRIGKPAVMGLYLLLDGRTGEPQALIDGQRLTLWRTAAASALAATYLARADAERLLLVGAGALAPFLARAHAGVRPIKDIRVWNRSPANAERIAKGLRAEGHESSATTDLDASVGWADIVSCATISPTPLVKGKLLRPGAHVDLVGAFTPEMRESDDEAVRRASVFVDTRGGALKEAGDIVQPLAAGVIRQEDVRADLAELSRGEHAGRASDEEITLFKSVGAALEDLAAGILVFERAGSNGEA